jgi:hypothetical protein
MNPIIILERLGKTSLAIRAKSQFSWKATRRYEWLSLRPPLA